MIVACDTYPAAAVCNQPTCCCQTVAKLGLLRDISNTDNSIVSISSERIAQNLLLALSCLGIRRQARCYWLDQSETLKLAASLWHAKHKWRPSHSREKLEHCKSSWHQHLEEPQTHGSLSPPSLGDLKVQSSPRTDPMSNRTSLVDSKRFVLVFIYIGH